MRRKSWNADDRVGDGYKDTVIPEKNQSPLEKGYESDYSSHSKPSSSRMPLKSPFKGTIFRKTNESIDGNLFLQRAESKKL